MQTTTRKWIGITLTLAMLMGSQKSQALETETCYTAPQIHRINEFRKDCEKCQLDLADTRHELDQCVLSPIHDDHSLAVITALGGIVVGAAIASSHGGTPALWGVAGAVGGLGVGLIILNL